MLSGIDSLNGYVKGDPPQFIRYAKSMSFKVTMDPTQEEMLYVPYLEIEYRERRLSDL